MDKVTVYQRKDGKWAWRRLSDNGQVVSTDGGQGYNKVEDALDMATRVNHGIPVTVTPPGELDL